jgi:uncharacterized membrane protein YhaH (DUF805 family)
MKLSDLLFSSQGRIPRSTYWYYSLAVAGISLPFALWSSFSRNSDLSTVIGCITGILSLVFIYPGLMVGIKRFHDRNRSGWFLLLSYIPLVVWIIGFAITIPTIALGNDLPDTILGIGGTLFLFLMCVSYIPSLWVLIELGFQRGTVGDNKYGPDPLLVGASSGYQGSLTPVQLTGELLGEVPGAGGARVCPSCGEVIDSNAIFCKHCGKEL